MPWVAPKTDFVNGDVLTATQMNNIGGDLAMLNGGTTGQVLSKASNANGDFAWTSETDPNAIPKTLIDAKGDLIAGSASDTAARLAVGTNGQVLTADSTTATGLKWAAASSGSYTKIASGTFNATTFSLANSTFTSSYNDYIVMYVITGMSTSATIQGRLRASGSDDSNTNYNYGAAGYTSGLTASNYGGASQTLFQLGFASSSEFGCFLTFYGPQINVATRISGTTIGNDSGQTNYAGRHFGGVFTGTTQFDAFTLLNNSGATMTGRYAVYGLEK